MFWKRRTNEHRSPAVAPAGVPSPRGEAEVLDHLSDALILVDSNRAVSSLNAAARRLFVAPEHAIGRPLLEIVRDHRLDAIVLSALKTGAEQITELDQSASGRTLRARAIPLPAAGEIALVVEDLSKLRQLETVRQQFVANLSHELRTPLAGLDLAAQTLARQLPGDGEERVFIDRVLKETQRLTAILTNLTQLAALDTEQIRPERTHFPVPALLAENVARYAGRAEIAGIALRVDCPTNLEAWGDRSRTDQALQSIVDNALKFTRSGEVVLAGRELGQEAVEISVRDSGIGIPAQDLPRIFERFYKLDRARSAAGTGLGLSLARHLVELQGGTLMAESTPGAGTTLRIRLPGPRP
jgi:two-component system phosphate regulon sensor histidine kinase PhoR